MTQTPAPAMRKTEIEDGTPYILVLYYSTQGGTLALANAIAQGIKETGIGVRCRTVLDNASTNPAHPIATLDDLKHAQGLALGSPTYFGAMAAPLKAFLDQTVTLWQDGSLQNKPACVFTTSASQHGGHEMTLISMMVPLLHHGMLILGLSYAEESLSRTQKGGAPYGAGHITNRARLGALSPDEHRLATALGHRLGHTAKKLLAGEGCDFTKPYKKDI